MGFCFKRPANTEVLILIRIFNDVFLEATLLFQR